MDDISTTVFIIDTYNKYQHNDNCRAVFQLHGTDYCVREVPLNWGQPQFPEKDWDDEFTQWQLYNTLDEALEFVRKLKRLNY